METETKPDIFDQVAGDIFDQLELSPEEKVVHSEDMERLVREEIQKAIAKLPIGKMVAGVIKKETMSQERSHKRYLDEGVEKAKGLLKEECAKLKAELEEFKGKLVKNQDAFKSLFGRDAKPWYQFGGYPIGGAGGDGGEADSVEGIDLDDEEGELLWRFTVVDGNLSVQKLVDDVWTEAALYEIP